MGAERKEPLTSAKDEPQSVGMLTLYSRWRCKKYVCKGEPTWEGSYQADGAACQTEGRVEDLLDSQRHNTHSEECGMEGCLAALKPQVSLYYNIRSNLYITI